MYRNFILFDLVGPDRVRAVQHAAHRQGQRSQGHRVQPQGLKVLIEGDSNPGT